MLEKQLFSLDRIEGDVAVLLSDTGECCTVPLSQMPATPESGKIYRVVGNGFIEDPVAEEARRANIRSLQNRLRSKNK